MHKDALTFERLNLWRYYCDEPGCFYVSKELNLPTAQLAQRIHRHRHIVGLAGIYHQTGHDT